MPDSRTTGCRICSLDSAFVEQQPDRVKIQCRNCGQFILTGTAESTVQSAIAETPRLAAVIAHAMQRMQRSTKWPVVGSGTIERLKKEGTLPAPAEQAENFILWLGEAQDHPGIPLEIEFALAPARIGAVDADGVRFILDAMEADGLVHARTDSGGASISLSFEGWEGFDVLTRKASRGPRAFMAMAYGNSELDEIYRLHFKPAVAATGFDLFRLDEAAPAGLIDALLRVEIRRSSFLVADLSDGNRGAYWEAGFAEGLGKPVIYTCEKSVFEDVGTHFDTSHMLTVSWDTDAPEEAAKKLKATVRATLPEDARMDDPE